MVADTENSESLKGSPKFDGKDSEQSRQEISVNAERTWSPETSKATCGPPRNAGAEARKEYKSVLQKRKIRNDNAYYNDATYSSAKYDVLGKEVADTYHKECEGGNPPWGQGFIS